LGISIHNRKTGIRYTGSFRYDLKAKLEWEYKNGKTTTIHPNDNFEIRYNLENVGALSSIQLMPIENRGDLINQEKPSKMDIDDAKKGFLSYPLIKFGASIFLNYNLSDMLNGILRISAFNFWLFEGSNRLWLC